MKQISIIGLSRSGKTCYIYAMARTMKRGVNNISIFTPDDIMRDKLKIGWQTISKEKKWPKGSDKITHCEFQCLIHLRPVMDFCWNDYKGGILNSFDEVSLKEKMEFYKYLANSAGIIFCVSADMINRILDGDDDELEELDNLNDFILHKNVLPMIKNIPVTIAVTKSDLFPNEDIKQSASEIIKDRLTALFSEGNQVSVLIVPVTLGEGLSGKQGEKITGIINADPKKGNIHLPIMFNLYFAIRDYIYDAHDALNSLKRELNTSSSNLSKALNHNWIQRQWFGENIDDLKGDIRKLKVKISEEEEYLEILENDWEKVSKEFSHDCEIYINGILQK